ncbi:MAG: pilus assembly protein PilW [Gammaproteobacteria bacterium]|nr:pilus assembly protein PilW [Gammaproteobacteria bacterium]
MNKHQRGISMVEILVSLVISLFLLGGIVQVYVANKVTYKFTDSISRIQENGRFAMEIVAQDLRMAGFWGCANFDPDDTENIVNNLDVDSPDYNPLLHDFAAQGAIQGTENDGLNGSDSFSLLGSKPNQVNVHPPYNVATSDTLHVSLTNNIETDDIVMVSNCKGADIFQITNITNSVNAAQMAVVHNTGAGSPGNYNPDTCKGGGNVQCLSQTYGSDAALFELQAVTYTIAAGASGEPALWRSENGTNLELIEGVEEMQLLYGIDDDSDNFANQYITSDAVADMNDVIAVRFMLLLRSEDAFVSEAPQTYTFNGNTVTPNDRRLRQVFSTTIGLRNRIGA